MINMNYQVFLWLQVDQVKIDWRIYTKNPNKPLIEVNN